MSQTSLPPVQSSLQATRIERFILNHTKKLVLASFVAMFVLKWSSDAFFSWQEKYRENAEAYQASIIFDALYLFVQQNHGAYPTGQSSTEIFQQLIMKKYISDPTIFYFPMPGKTKATSYALKPENVCWDITGGVDLNSPDELPVIYTTGYKINYTPGSKALPLVKPDLPGMAVVYKDGAALVNYPGVPFISPYFNAKGKTFRQLTPSGPLQ